MGNPKRSAIGGLVLVCVLVLLLLPSVGEAQTCTVTRFGTPFASIQAAVIQGGTVLVSGICNESVTIGHGQNVTLDGQGTATLQGTIPNNATITVSGDATIRDFLSIRGGQDGVRVIRGGFAVIVNSKLELNTRDGIALVEGGTARIGVLRGDDAAASPNIIQNNGRRGVTVTRSSTARIVGNTIQNNTEDGVLVSRVSHADISSNTINGNGDDGIFVSQNSGVNLGNDTGTTIFDLPNTTTVNNGGFGIACSSNSYANGRSGSLKGNSGPEGFDASCVNSLVP